MKKLNLLKAASSITALLLMFVIASPALAQDTTNTNDAQFQEWDADRSGDLSLDEFRTGISGTGYYSNWDSDSNDTLSQDEWNSGMQNNMSDYDSEFQQWDEDGDGILNEDEFYQGSYNTIDENSDEVMDGYEWGNWFDNGIF